MYKDNSIKKFGYEGQLRKWLIDGKDVYKGRCGKDGGHWSTSAL